MAKTAVDLTPEQKLAYRPGEAIEQRQKLGEGDRAIENRWQKAQLLAQQAAKLLRKEFGAHRVLLFGSTLHRPWFTLWSDVDLAVWGLPPERFYAAVAAVTGLSSEIPIDLVEAEHCSQTLRMTIEQTGREI